MRDTRRSVKMGSNGIEYLETDLRVEQRTGPNSPCLVIRIADHEPDIKEANETLKAHVREGISE
jgi:hypothetical protein